MGLIWCFTYFYYYAITYLIANILKYNSQYDLEEDEDKGDPTTTNSNKKKKN